MGKQWHWNTVILQKYPFHCGKLKSPKQSPISLTKQQASSNSGVMIPKHLHQAKGESMRSFQRDMTISMRNAQLFGEKYEHLNGADTWPFLCLP